LSFALGLLEVARGLGQRTKKGALPRERHGRSHGGVDLMFGGRGADVIDGGTGDDEIRGNDANDTINAGAGDDAVWGGRGADTINGGPGDDLLRGRRGADTIPDASAGVPRVRMVCDQWGQVPAPGLLGAEIRGVVPGPDPDKGAPVLGVRPRSKRVDDQLLGAVSLDRV